MDGVLDQLELVEGFVRKTKEEGIAVVHTRGEKTVKKDSTGMGGGS